MTVTTHGLREWLMLSYQTFITFPNLSILTLCCFINFCHLIKPLSSYQTSVIISPLVIYSLFTLSSHPINSPTVHITSTTTLFPSYRAHALCANIPFLLTRRLWPSCHSDYGGDRTVAGGFLIKQTDMFYIHFLKTRFISKEDITRMALP